MLPSAAILSAVLASVTLFRLSRPGVCFRFKRGPSVSAQELLSMLETCIKYASKKTDFRTLCDEVLVELVAKHLGEDSSCPAEVSSVGGRASSSTGHSTTPSENHATMVAAEKAVDRNIVPYFAMRNWDLATLDPTQPRAFDHLWTSHTCA